MTRQGEKKFMDCVLLGSGGWIPTGTRETCSALVRHGRNVLVIDAGTGIRRLLERPDLVAEARNVHILLTHFHLDHVVGLSYLPALPLDRPPVIWGAGERLVGASTRSILERLLGPPLFAVPLEALTDGVHEIPEGTFELESFAVASRVQTRHSHPSLAFRIGDALTYCTDTAPDRENVAFASGSHALLHEAWYAQETTDDRSHSAGGDAGRIAREAAVERLVLIHVNPLLSSDESLAMSARAEFPNTEVGRDLARVPLR